MAVLYEAGEFTTPQLLSCKENELGLRQWLEDKVLIVQDRAARDQIALPVGTLDQSQDADLCTCQGHEYVVVSDKDGPESEFEKEIQDADVMISTPFHPAYLTKCDSPRCHTFASLLLELCSSALQQPCFVRGWPCSCLQLQLLEALPLCRERLEKAKNLKLAITAGIGSDHVDLHAAAEHGLTVAEATGDAVLRAACCVWIGHVMHATIACMLAGSVVWSPMHRWPDHWVGAGSNNVSTAEQAVLCILRWAPLCCSCWGGCCTV